MHVEWLEGAAPAYELNQLQAWAQILDKPHFDSHRKPIYLLISLPRSPGGMVWTRNAEHGMCSALCCWQIFVIMSS